MLRTNLGILIGATVLLAAPAHSTLNHPFESTRGDTAERMSNKAPRVWLADDIIGKNILSAQNEEIGKVEDLIIHPGGKVAFAVLSFDNMMGMGDKYYAVPFTLLEARDADATDKKSVARMEFALTKDRLKNAPGFEKKNWPAMTTTEWSKDVEAFYAGDMKSEHGRPLEASSSRTAVIWKCSALKDFNVETPNGTKLGEIEHVAIDVHGAVSYVVISVGGFLGVGEKYVAVPWAALTTSREGEKGDKWRITLDTTKERLAQAPEFKSGKDKWLEMSDPIWIGHVYEYYTVHPYWSGSKEKDSERDARKHRQSDTDDPK